LTKKHKTIQFKGKIHESREGITIGDTKLGSELSNFFFEVLGDDAIPYPLPKKDAPKVKGKIKVEIELD